MLTLNFQLTISGSTARAVLISSDAKTALYIPTLLGKIFYLVRKTDLWPYAYEYYTYTVLPGSLTRTFIFQTSNNSYIVDTNGCLPFFSLSFPGPHSSLYTRSACQMDPAEREEQDGSIRLRRLVTFTEEKKNTTFTNIIIIQRILYGNSIIVRYSEFKVNGMYPRNNIIFGVGTNFVEFFYERYRKRNIITLFP